MLSQWSIFATLEAIIYMLIILLALIYSIPIVFIRRFHQPNHIFTLNVSVAMIFCCLSWFPSVALSAFNDSLQIHSNVLLFIQTAQLLFTVQIPFSFVVTSLYRYCFIIYDRKMRFNRKRWIILCIGSQWILGFFLAIPNVVCDLYIYCGWYMWSSIYIIIYLVVIPSVLCFILNMFIYKYVRSSTRRVQPQMGPGENQQPKINRRDIFLLRHMIFMFCIFVGGWAPVYISIILSFYISIQLRVFYVLSTWCELTILIDMIDLFLYNHELRNFLKDIRLRIGF